MIIKIWGSRGAIPVSGKQYLIYGGDTTCLEIRTNSGDIIVVDAGTGIRRLGNQLAAGKWEQLHLLFTHAHWDHLMGFAFFRPLFFKRFKIRLYRCSFHDRFIADILSQLMAPPLFPVSYSEITARMDYPNAGPEAFDIGSVKVIPIVLSHPNGGSGYKFVENNRSFVFLTDNELGYVHPGGLRFSDYVDFCRQADLLVHDAEYTPGEYKTLRTWGHSSYADVLELATRAGVKKLGLFHLNRERSDDAMEVIVNDCRSRIAAQNLNLECVGVAADMVFEI